ncbi:hypothetical protein M8C17_01285 [Micromonospora sp. RHAY321]|uniref:hypothetical protein n=1 Tax=Micromonospora sp. RHAY321 TaxID=2944807 RepID=UPI00207C297D|nr:hypothetical protein [Micromonospora sp. RHAY321]MCO1593793.1 hypothetical protein [Micromonospora sp. RHAY321]
MDIYENPPLAPHGQADEALTAALEGRNQALSPNSVLVGLALYDDDRIFVEGWCNRIAHESTDLWLVATASLCLGHLARRFGYLEPESVMLVRRLAERTDLDGRVFSALDDVTFFLEELPNRRKSEQGD